MRSKIFTFISYAFLLAAALIVTIVPAQISFFRALTPLEDSLISGALFYVGLWGSLLLGKLSAKEVGKDLIRAQARYAFRRVFGLYQGLSRLASAIADAQQRKSEEVATLDKLQALVTEQIKTADFIIEDWRDLVPEDVNEILHQLNEKLGSIEYNVTNPRKSSSDS